MPCVRKKKNWRGFFCHCLFIAVADSTHAFRKPKHRDHNNPKSNSKTIITQQQQQQLGQSISSSAVSIRVIVIMSSCNSSSSIMENSCNNDIYDNKENKVVENNDSTPKAETDNNNNNNNKNNSKKKKKSNNNNRTKQSSSNNDNNDNKSRNDNTSNNYPKNNKNHATKNNNKNHNNKNNHHQRDDKDPPLVEQQQQQPVKRGGTQQHGNDGTIIARTDNDPRRRQQQKDSRITANASRRGKGRNTESFDPASTLVRPDLRIRVGSNQHKTFPQPLKHDDVVIVPELFGSEDDWTLYEKLLRELTTTTTTTAAGKNNINNGGGVEWVSWHEGAHLITRHPEQSPTYHEILDRICEYFNISKNNLGTRLNWYTDSVDWKPFHHDSAAFNPQRAKHQNITVGASFGATRELAFIRASQAQKKSSSSQQQQQQPQGGGILEELEEKPQKKEEDDKVRLYFPQPNNSVFSFGRDANIRWKHGINALHPEEQDGKGRISIIVWGLAQGVVEEEGSPPLLGAEQGHGGRRRYNSSNGRGGRGRNNHNRGGGGRGGTKR